ncbi:kinase-like domain-containing protein [Ephemerocybe angulata]|uniref:Kinase-like domain-containing protein n=1 Tax=Ephemerocybe angulata TaxID=980116 RepID=A0A8H6I590_9AGAR|nr:kinase-like domain-containing protein [Tulosesus angulatus]
MSLNNLVTLARSYEASPNKGSVLKTIVDILTSNEPIDTHQHLAQVAGSDAQILMDAFQHVSHFVPAIPFAFKAKILDAMTRLAPKGAVPSDLLIEVDQINPSTFYQAPCADVYKGNKAGRLLCLKTYRAHEIFTSANVIEMTCREATIMFNLHHPNILHFEGLCKQDIEFPPGGTKLYLVSPFYENGTVCEYLEANPDAERLPLLRDALHGVEYLHDNLIAHGDIKGDNILIKPSGRACIADFGLARVLSNLDPAPGSTVLTGTLEWQAPEILESRLDDKNTLPTVASDVYSLGCLIYEASTSSSPPWSSQIMEEVALHGQRPAKPLDSDDAFQRFGLTNQIWNLAEACWAREAGLRPSATQLLGSSPFNVSV